MLAGTESAAGTGQHGRGFPRRTQRRMHGKREGVELVGPVKRQARDITVHNNPLFRGPCASSRKPPAGFARY